MYTFKKVCLSLSLSVCMSLCVYVYNLGNIDTSMLSKVGRTPIPLFLDVTLPRSLSLFLSRALSLSLARSLILAK